MRQGSAFPLLFAPDLAPVHCRSMQLSEEELDGFIEAVKVDLGIELPRAEARECATRLLELYKLIHRPLPWEADPSIPVPDWASDLLSLPDDPAPGAL